jgi:hypothetical protein
VDRPQDSPALLPRSVMRGLMTPRSLNRENEMQAEHEPVKNTSISFLRLVTS